MPTIGEMCAALVDWVADTLQYGGSTEQETDERIEHLRQMTPEEITLKYDIIFNEFWQFQPQYMRQECTDGNY